MMNKENTNPMPASNPLRQQQSPAVIAVQKVGRVIPKVVLYAVMLGLSFVFLYPFLYMLVTSFKTSADLNNVLVAWIPRSLEFGNYKMAVQLMNYWKTMSNSAIVTVLGTLGQLISCAMAGYALARFDFFGKRLASMFVILAMLIPTTTIIVPQYLLYGNFGWFNTFYPLIVPCFFGFGVKGALFIYIFRQFFLGQPRELEEAAKVDGCGFIRVFTHIVCPVAKSVFVVVLVLALVWHWSDYFEPSMYLNKADIQLVSMRVQSITEVLKMAAEALESSQGITEETPITNATLMAGTFIVVLPILVVYSMLQKQFIQGIERSGLTGE